MVNTSHSHPVICILAPKHTHGNIHTNSMKIHFVHLFSEGRNFGWLLFDNITKEAQFSVFPQKQKLICLGATIQDWQDGKPVTSRALVTLAEAHNRTTWGAGCDPSASHRLKYKYNQNTKNKCKHRKNTNTNVVKRKKNKYKYWYSQTEINF